MQREVYRAFDNITMPDGCSRRIEEAMLRRLEEGKPGAYQSQVLRERPRRRSWAATAMAACLLCLVTLGGVLVGLRGRQGSMEPSSASQPAAEAAAPTLSAEAQERLQALCLYLPDWETEADMDGHFWSEFLFRSFTCPQDLGNGAARTPAGDVSWSADGRVLVPRELARGYVKTYLGRELPDFTPDLGDALRYEDGVYSVSVSDFGSVEYVYQGLEALPGGERYQAVLLEYAGGALQPENRVIFTLKKTAAGWGYTVEGKKTEAYQALRLTQEGRDLLEKLCGVMPDWSGYASLNNDFWVRYLSAALTHLESIQDGSAQTVAGDVEYFSDGRTRIPRAAAERFVLDTMGCELPALRTGQDMGLWEKDGTFTAYGAALQSGNRYVFRECSYHREAYDEYAFAYCDVYGYEDGREQYLGEVEFTVYPAENQYGFTVISKTYTLASAAKTQALEGTYRAVDGGEELLSIRNWEEGFCCLALELPERGPVWCAGVPTGTGLLFEEIVSEPMAQPTLSGSVEVVEDTLYVTLDSQGAENAEIPRQTYRFTRISGAVQPMPGEDISGTLASFAADTQFKLVARAYAQGYLYGDRPTMALHAARTETLEVYQGGRVVWEDAGLYGELLETLNGGRVAWVRFRNAENEPRQLTLELAEREGVPKVLYVTEEDVDPTVAQEREMNTLALEFAQAWLQNDRKGMQSRMLQPEEWSRDRYHGNPSLVVIEKINLGRRQGEAGDCTASVAMRYLYGPEDDSYSYLTITMAPAGAGWKVRSYAAEK